jgi:hypothetical protein
MAESDNKRRATENFAKNGRPMRDDSPNLQMTDTHTERKREKNGCQMNNGTTITMATSWGTAHREKKNNLCRKRNWPSVV